MKNVKVAKATKTQAQAQEFTLEQIHSTLADTGIKLLENESATEMLRSEIERVILFLKEKKIKLTQRVNRTAPHKGCPVLSFVAIKADNYYRSLRIEKSMREGLTRKEAEAEADSATARKSIEQMTNNLNSRIRASVSAGRWLTKGEYQKLAAKKSANKASKASNGSNKTGKPEGKAKAESGKTTAEKLRLALNTLIQMIQNDEDPIGYDPVELVSSLKEALDCID